MLLWIHFQRIKILVAIWKKFKHRLPLKLYQEQMLQIADFLFGIKVFDKSPKLEYLLIFGYHRLFLWLNINSVCATQFFQSLLSVLVAVNSLFYYLTHWFCSQYLQSWFCCSKTIRSLWICCLLRINYMLTHSQCYFSSLCFFKLYQLALRQGYSLHLSQFSSVKITDITNVDQFMACFFPEGLDTDQNTFAMKVRYTSLCDCVCPVYLCLECCVITGFALLFYATKKVYYIGWGHWHFETFLLKICYYSVCIHVSVPVFLFFLFFNLYL